MKKTLLLIGLAFIMSCANEPKPQPKLPAKRKVDVILDKIMEKYPNFKDNGIVREKATVDLKNSIDSVLPLGHLDEIPLKVMYIKSNPYGKRKGTAMVKLYSDNFERDSISRLSDRLNFDVIGLMDEKLALKLSNYDIVRLYSKKRNRITIDMSNVLFPMSHYSDEVKIDNDIIYEVPEFEVGHFMVEVDSIKIIKKSVQSSTN